MSKKMRLTPAALHAFVAGDVENFIVASTPGGIENQEAMGQAAMVGTRDVLPMRSPREKLTKLGFVFLGDVDGRKLFVDVQFPAGWKKVATDHSMWSNLLDPKSRVRGTIFYKAAFYDERADMYLNSYYKVKCEHFNADDKTCSFDVCTHSKTFVVNADGDPVSPIVVVRYEEERKFEYMGKDYCAAARRRMDEEDAAHKTCREFLDKKFPDWNDPLAYWD
jgi:hypothetical protein